MKFKKSEQESAKEYLLEKYLPLLDFLAEVLGKDTEIVLHNAKELDQSIIAIRNGHVTGRQVGHPATNLVLKLIKQGHNQKTPYICNYTFRSKLTSGGSQIRSSSYFIKKDGDIIGILCINRDITKYQLLFDNIAEIQKDFAIDNFAFSDEVKETFTSNIQDVIANELAVFHKDVTNAALTQAEKMTIVKELQKQGIFLLKGAVKEVAKTLQTSEPTIYRYLQNLSHK